MTTSQPQATAEERLAVQFGALQPGEDIALGELRKRAFERFETVGLPHRRIEAYKYTDLKRRLTDMPARAARAQAPLPAIAGPDGARQIELLNGHLATGSIDDLEGVTLQSLRALMESANLSLLMADEASQAAQLAAQDPLVQLNTAFMMDGAVLNIAAGAQVAQPIELVHRLSAEAAISDQALGQRAEETVSRAATYVRHIVTVEAGAEVTLLESQLSGSAAHIANTVIELRVGEGAKVTLARRQEGGADDQSFSTALVDLSADAHLQYYSMNVGSDLSRGQIFLKCVGERAHADLLGTTICRNAQLLDTTLFIDHAVPNCTSTEQFKTAVWDRGQSVFQGKIIVRQKAQKTDAQMMSRSLLLSDEAEAINKPELEIYADDVQCAHGATVGTLDEDMLFYMLSRGIPRLEAEQLLVQAFLAEPIETLDHEVLRSFLLGRMIERLKG